MDLADYTLHRLHPFHNPNIRAMSSLTANTSKTFTGKTSSKGESTKLSSMLSGKKIDKGEWDPTDLEDSKVKAQPKILPPALHLQGHTAASA
jgi:hypothetical protein